MVKLVYQSFWQMITGKVGVDQMSGPVGIVSEVNNAVNSGSYSWFVLIEMIRRKAIPPEKEGIVHAVGMLLLLAFIVFVSFHDIMRLFNK